MIYSIYSQQYMVRRSYVLVSLILSSCSLEYGVKEYLIDSKGYSGISNFWNYLDCEGIWSFNSIDDIATCFPKRPEHKANCMLLSLSYKINEARELYMNIQTETRDCATLNNSINCTGKLSLSVNYPINKNDFQRVILPDEIPLNIYKKQGNFVATNDTVSFSVDRNYNSLRLGFQAPFYCGHIKSVSIYRYLCPAKTNALVDFQEVPAPSKISSPYTSFGTCTRNAVKKSSSRYLSMNCYYNGTAQVFGSCECESGYTKNKNLCEGEWFSLFSL